MASNGNTKRDKFLNIRVSEAERELINSRYPGGYGEQVRNILLGNSDTIKSISITKKDPQLIRELARIGNNLNQLTKAVNSGILPSDIKSQLHAFYLSINNL